MVQLLAGTSGYSYKEWLGNFYPKGTKNGEMLHQYAQQLPSVEINNTFYRMPRGSVVDQWSNQTPETFRFAIKASRRITHSKKLQNAQEEVSYLFGVLERLEHRLGVVLFQLPPFFQKDVEVLKRFLAILPSDFSVAFEFRHRSWWDDNVRECLASHGAALCVTDKDEVRAEDLHSTVDWGYLRLRRTSYSDTDLRHWMKLIQGAKWKTAFVFFKHEADGAGPSFAQRLLELST
ncbi:MAG: DUF72 domain-containing protein [Pseudomonadota bacterium]